MACRSQQMWSLTGLMAAFLDLAIAYVLLCASAVAYFASKFLGFFGLHLPCLCDGTFFSIGNESFCLSRLLDVFPGETVSHVVLSVVEKFPIHNWDLKIRNLGAVDDVCVDGIVELEGEASCSSVGDVVRVKEMSGRAEKYDLKGKGVFSFRPRSRLRQRRKGCGGLGKNSGIGAGDPSLCEAALGVEPYLFGSSVNKKGNGLAGGISTMGVNEAQVYSLEYHDKVPTTGVTKREVDWLERNPSHGEDMLMTHNTLHIEELQNDQKGIQNFGEDEENAIRILERKLEEERSARAALYSELEKERSAAASAADEAMAMILRLQEEKASIEMEARQYQRILEEKSVYDAEEMVILQEILIRREKEKYFLEKEVEAYRQMASEGNEQLESGRFDPNEISRESTGSNYIEKNTTVENNFSSFVVSAAKPTSKLAYVDESPIQSHIERSFFEKHGNSDEQSLQSVCDNAGNMDLQEKEIISVDNSVQVLSKVTKEFRKGAPLEGEELEQVQDLNSGLQPDEKIIIPCTGTKMDDPGCGPSSERDASVHDVHIDGINFFCKANADKSKSPLFSNSMKVDVKNSASFEAATAKRFDVITANWPSSSASETAFDVKRSNSEASQDFPLVLSRGSSRSITTMNLELLKISSEVGWLQQKLKLVQEGRDKLSLSGENRDRVDIQLKLLEDIARQVQEICHLTETGKAVRQGSLPIPTSKVLTKKRRSRSVSSGVQMSSDG